jgi:CRISPR-associated protein Cas2
MPLSVKRYNHLSRYLFCYDIADDRRRRQLVKCLEDYGCRVQFSVFELLLNDRLLEQMKKKVDEVVDYEQDSIMIYELDANCEQKIIRNGVSRYAPPKDEVLMII